MGICNENWGTRCQWLNQANLATGQKLENVSSNFGEIRELQAFPSRGKVYANMNEDQDVLKPQGHNMSCLRFLSGSTMGYSWKKGK